MKITLKDNVIAEVTKGMTIEAIASGISESLAKSAICGKINGELVDLKSTITKNCKLEIITMKDSDALRVLRHSCSHILAQAIKSVYPNAKYAGGDSCEDGFFCDFDFKTPITKNDLSLIEDEMQHIIDANFDLKRTEISREEAFRVAEDQEEPYIIEKLGKIEHNSKLAVYTQGDFMLFCDGPHIRSTGLVKAFKLTKIENSHIDNNLKNKKVIRITGVAFFLKKDLDQYIKISDGLLKRNHQLIGENLSYFMSSNEDNIKCFLPLGEKILHNFHDLSKSIAKKYMFSEIAPIGKNMQIDEIYPQVYQHLFNKQNLFPVKIFGFENYQFSTVCQEEGLLKLEYNTHHKFVSFVDNDSLNSSLKEQCDMADEFYSVLGFGLSVKLHYSDKNIKDEYIKAKSAIKKFLLKRYNVIEDILTNYKKEDVIKVEFDILDNLGRIWNMGSIHIDLAIAKSEGLICKEDNGISYPIVIVNNICKSYERIFAIMLENNNGQLPFWLSPINVKIVAKDEHAIKEAKKFARDLTKNNLSCELYAKKKGIVKKDPIIPFTVVVDEDASCEIVGEKDNKFFVKELLKKFIDYKKSRQI